MLARLLRRVSRAGCAVLHALRRRLVAATKPAAPTVLAGSVGDLARSKTELVAENAPLRQQLVVLTRRVKRPRCTPTDRSLLVLLASRVAAWREALLIVQPDTLLRWLRQLFRGFWRRKSWGTPKTRPAKVSPETIALIREMAAANTLWGAERIRGELGKLDIRVAKWAVQKYLRDARSPRRTGQPWGTFLRNHGGET
jgi:putative transposase